MYDGTTYIVPCSRGKLDRPAPARDLYVGAMFRHTYANAQRRAALDEESGRPARVLILSAFHGLLEPDRLVTPYDLKMGDPGSVTYQHLFVQALALGIGWAGSDGRATGREVYTLLPKAYTVPLETALKLLGVYPLSCYEGCRSIGEQRQVNARLGMPTTQPTYHRDHNRDHNRDRDGLRVWIGTDVNGFSWGLPILVSYGRLRVVRVLPVATAPWVCDSRGYAEVAQHGRWTIPADVYLNDLRRYATDIGRMEWAAPQDWPANPKVLAVTGLSETEHQRRTVDSVVWLRAAAPPSVPIVCVVSGTSVSGCLRHVGLYRQAGIDLTAETLPIGVGALVGRPPEESARIIRALHDAGLRRLHAFGVAGPVLDQVGAILDSIDSAKWSLRARHTGDGRCQHGIVKYETNCPKAAQEWADLQRARAAAAPREMAYQPALFDLDTSSFTLTTR